MQAMLMSAPPSMTTASLPTLVPEVSALPEPLPEPVKPLPVAKPKPVLPPKPIPATKPVPANPAIKQPDAVKPKPVIEPPDEELAAIEKESKRISDEQAATRKQREADARQKAIADALKAEADAIAADAANERARRMSAQIGEFQLAINRKIKSSWRRPAAVAGKLVTELRITLLPGGEVASVVVVKSSGNDAFDESAKDAVSRANPLPVPSDPALFREQFKVLLLKFKPEE